MSKQTSQQKVSQAAEEQVQEISGADFGEKLYRYFLIGGIVVIAFVLVIGASALIGRSRETTKAKSGAYIMIGDYPVSKTELDYYTTKTAQTYTSQYESLLSLMGYDKNVAPEMQQYLDTEMSWLDYFQKLTMETLQEQKILLHDATEEGFTYDSSQQVENFKVASATLAETLGVPLDQFYKDYYGEYATEDALVGFLQEETLIDAYYNEIMRRNAPSEDDIKITYQAAPQNYDKAAFHFYYFISQLDKDASEEEQAAAQEENKRLAAEMVSRLENGEDFNDLCIEYSGDAETYAEGNENNYTPAIHYNAVPESFREWVFDPARKPGDATTAMAKDVNDRCGVIQFDERTTDWDEITETISKEQGQAFLKDYVDKKRPEFPISDPDGHLKYLQVEE